MLYAIKINGMYLKGFIYPREGKRTTHLIREPHYFTTSEIEGKMAVLFNTISSGVLAIDKFEVEVITCETDGKNGDHLN